MQIHVFESTSSKPIARDMAKHNLAVCMLAMEELGNSYISATAAHKLFDTAIQKVEQARGSEQAPGTPPRLPPPVAMDQADGHPSASSWENWPEGYSASTASVIADVWLPWTWMNGLGTRYVAGPALPARKVLRWGADERFISSSEVWMDFQDDTNGALGNDDSSHVLMMAEWTD